MFDKSRALARIGSMYLVLALSAGCSMIDENSPLGGLNPFKEDNSLPEPPPPPPKIDVMSLTDSQVDCPVVDIIEGTSAVRVGGEENAAVRYQYSLADVSRQCSVVKGTLVVRMSILGRVLLGPSGAPGTFQIPVRVAIRANKTQKMVTGSLYHTSVTIAPGQTQGLFTIHTDPMSVPLLGPEASQDYLILAGFDNGKAQQPDIKRRRKR